MCMQWLYTNNYGDQVIGIQYHTEGVRISMLTSGLQSLEREELGKDWKFYAPTGCIIKDVDKITEFELLHSTSLKIITV